MGNGINLSGAIIKAHRMNISTISSEKPALPQKMNILAYLFENFFIIKIHISTMRLNDLNGILEIYLIVINGIDFRLFRNRDPTIARQIF